MQSNYVLITTIVACLGFLINGTVLFFVLSRGRKKYHYLFAALLFLQTIGAINVFLIYLRSSYPDEVIIYAKLFIAGGSLIPALIYHFTCSYLNQPRKKSTIYIWAFGVISLTGFVSGIAPIHLESIFRFLSGAHFQFFVWTSCWFLFRAHRRETSHVVRRHMLYIFISLSVIALINLTMISSMDPFATGSLLGKTVTLLKAIFGALVGIAIIKYRLFDINVIIKKTTIYSILLALTIFVFSLSEHMLATYVGGIFGEHSIFIHIISIAVVIAVLMPIRQKLERAIERFFARKTVEF